jgi:hypothetical protein
MMMRRVNFGLCSQGYYQSRRKRGYVGGGGSHLTPDDVGHGCPGDEGEPQTSYGKDGTGDSAHQLVTPDLGQYAPCPDRSSGEVIGSGKTADGRPLCSRGSVAVLSELVSSVVL